MPLLLILGALAGGVALYASQRRTGLDLFDEPEPAPAVTQQAAPTQQAAAPQVKRYINPLANAPFRLTSPFGYRSDPFTGQRTFHSGIDLATEAGTPIYAVAPGQVVKVFRGGNEGNGVKIQHTDGTASAYLHMVEAPPVSTGEVVSLGQSVGKVGSTGRSTKPHLHFMLYDAQGNKVDPAPLTSLLPWSSGRGTNPQQLVS